ncbi:glycosyltransferase 8 domain-containing protein 2 isoform X3 [Rattus norvegicus]|uniref:glycosyltransferase 8 domain-containing protein 2 isoform X3 n=1 Tax=Rattus norvegicus TaxID=10116 RepID=UPI001916E408|nr:glycosyltransferase 8 domain-containing protein 2 isoform X3 [Rattus norvegicus]
MALLRKINQVLLFLLVLTLCGILYKKVRKGAVLKNEADDDSESPEDVEEEIPVVICAAAGRMGAAMAAINSIYSNTDANIVFYVVGLRNTLSRIRQWIEHSKLKEINFKIVEFNPIVLKGKIRPDSSRPELLQPHEKVIYLDDDVIVQGDIQELYDTTLALGHAAAFSDDCDLPSAQDIHRLVGLQNTYMGYLDYRKKSIKELGISPSTCSFNPGVIVANMTEWKHQRITKQLEKWMQKNVEENLYSSSLGGGVATSPMLIVFHGKYSTINPLWHIRHLVSVRCMNLYSFGCPIPGTGITGMCELPEVGSGTQTLVFCKSNKCSRPLRHLSNPICYRP